MPLSQIPLLIFFVGVFATFGGVLGWASWQDSRATRLKNMQNRTIHG
jgi:hypothetical protein